MTEYKMTDKYIISGLQIGMILQELNEIDNIINGDDFSEDTVFDTTRRILEDVLKKEVSQGNKDD